MVPAVSWKQLAMWSLGGGVFLSFENTLDVSEEPTLQVDAELIWARLKIHKRQPIYIYIYVHFTELPITLWNHLAIYKITLWINCLVVMLVAGDFNLPDIMWMDGHGTIKANPAYVGLYQMLW